MMANGLETDAGGLIVGKLYVGYVGVFRDTEISESNLCPRLV